MLDHKSRCLQLATDQNSPMALEGIRFRTQQSESIALDTGPEARKARLKEVRRGQSRVLDAPINIAARTSRSCAQFGAQEDVCQSMVLKCFLKSVAIELGISCTVGRRSNVGYRGDAMFHQ